MDQPSALAAVPTEEPLQWPEWPRNMDLDLFAVGVAAQARRLVLEMRQDEKAEVYTELLPAEAPKVGVP